MFSIQHTTTGDISIIRELALKIWPQTYAAILSQEQIDYMLHLMYSEASLAKQMEEGAQFIFLIDGEEKVGFASYQEITSSVFKLNKIYVLPSQQGKGAGRFMIDHILSKIKAKGANALQLQVNKNNNARLFYEKLGFTVIDEMIIDIGSGYVMDDYLMQKNVA